MYETILVQELDLPSSGLARLEDYVPIPKFIAFNPVGLPTSIASIDNPDDQFFQYHFLAQVAHRIILTRIRNSLYFFCEFCPSLCVSVTSTNDAIFVCSGIWNPTSPSRKRRAAPSNRAMAPQPPPSNPVLRAPEQGCQRQPRTRRIGAGDSRVTGRRGRRSHASGAIPDRQIPYRPAVPVQSAADPGVPDRRRL